MDKKDYNRFIPLVLLTIITLAIGTIFYHYVENFSWLDSVYFCIVTLATIGYGDLTPKTTLGKVFTMIYILGGIGIIATFASTLFARRQEKFRKRHPKYSST